MIAKILHKLTAKRPARLIKLDGAPYLERYYVGQLFGATFYLHRFIKADPREPLHNHPWKWGRSLILSGSYVEARVVDMTVATDSGALLDRRRVRWWSVVDGNTFHRIEGAERETWSLFFHGPRVRIKSGQCSRAKGWGFLDKGLDCVVYTPYLSDQPAEWWHKAPTGEKVGREPF